MSQIRHRILRNSGIFALFIASSSSLSYAQSSLPWQQFLTPPDSCRTKTWWFHGEMADTREGITADLEAFKAGGIGGVVYYDQVHGDGKGTQQVFSSEWWDMLKSSAQEAKRIGLSFETAIGNGYVAGGPWITPELSMKWLVSSTAQLSSSSSKVQLPSPSKRKFWDVCVLAFPIPKNGGYQEVRALSNPMTTSESPCYIDITQEGGTFRSFTYHVNKRGKTRLSRIQTPGMPSDTFKAPAFTEYPPLGELECSNDGKNWRKVVALTPVYNEPGTNMRTVSFPATKAKYWRVNLHDYAVADNKDKSIKVSDFILSSMAMGHNWQERSGLFAEFPSADLTPNFTKTECVDARKVLDISRYMDSKGNLDVAASPIAHGKGDWIVVRIACESTRGQVKHGRKYTLGERPKEGGAYGYECDKLSKTAAEVHWNHYPRRVIDTLSTIGCKPEGIIMDSHEAGAQNWTFGFEQVFRQKRGYDIGAMMLALCGYVVNTAQETNQFLQDFRRTLSDAIADNYYATLDSLARHDGVIFTAQAVGNGQSIVADNLQVKGRVQKPQGEFWGRHHDGSYDQREAVSAAHIYGNFLGSAEAFTDATYNQSPGYLKHLADEAFINSVGELVICASAAQGMTPPPGNTANGRQYVLQRNNSYWPLIRPFFDYQARCMYMMRQGKAVNELLIYKGDDVPAKLTSWQLPAIPEGYDWDVCTGDGLQALYHHQGITKNGYKAIIIEKGAYVTPESRKLLDEWKRQGLLVLDASSDHILESLKVHQITPSWIILNGEQPQWSNYQKTPKECLLLNHRQIGDQHVFFIVNHTARLKKQEITFPTLVGKQAELWYPDGAKRKDVCMEEDGKVTLSLAPWESVFLVSKKPNSSSAPKEHPNTSRHEITLNLPWKVTFSEKMGGPKETQEWQKLTDWTTSTSPNIKYYSGVAKYENSFMLDKVSTTQSQYFLSIDKVMDIAKVTVNGKEVGTLWTQPYQLDITPYVKEGKNIIQIETANCLVNRIVGDDKLPTEQRVTFCLTPIYKGSTRLFPSGITGVKIIAQSAN